jgi:hypothetical protein
MTPLHIEGVLVSVCVSSTHIGYGTLRMEPVFMALGTAAGTAAHLALTQNVAPSQIRPAVLQRELLEQQQVLCVFHDVPLQHPHWAALQYFGTKGFFPEYEARPDANVTRAEAANWLWQWLQIHQANTPKTLEETAPYSDVSPEHPAYTATQALQRMRILTAGSTFTPQEVLSAETASQWLLRATEVLGWADEIGQLEPFLSETITRGEFCRRLYEMENAHLQMRG